MFTEPRIYLQNENNYREGGGRMEGRFVEHNLKIKPEILDGMELHSILSRRKYQNFNKVN